METCDMAERKVMLIFNPAANLGRAGRNVSDLYAAAQSVKGVRWVSTRFPTHATEIARQAAEESFELVIAVGGDGTVHEVVNGLMQAPAESRPCLSVIPYGSGNDFANAVGMDGNRQATLDQILTGYSRKVDVGKLRDGNSSVHYWDNTIGIGFDTQVVIRSRRIPLVRGFLIYLLSVFQTMIFDYESTRVLFKTDREQWEDDLMMLILCNGGREGGIFQVAPDAHPGDGKLQYTGVSRISRLKMLRLLPEFIQGTHARHPQVRLGDFRQLEITADRPLKIHADGEIISGLGSDSRNLRVEIIPGALEVMAPSTQL